MFKPLTKEQYESAIRAGFAPDKIIQMEQQRKAASQDQEPGYLSRVASDYKDKAQSIISDVQRPADLKNAGASPLKVAGAVAEAGLRTAGNVANAAFAPIVEAPVVKPVLAALGSAISKIPGISFLVQKANDLAQKHPQIAKDLQSIVDIATVSGGGGATEKGAGKILEKTGSALEESGQKAAVATKESFAKDLVSPIETKAVKLDQVSRTSEAGGFFKKDVVTPTSLESKAAKEVAQIPGVSQKATFQNNYNAIRDYNVAHAEQLEADLKKYDFAIPRDKVVQKLRAAQTSLESSPTIVGDASKTADKLLTKAHDLVQSSDGSASGLLKVRKDYDAWVLSQKPKAFDGATENAFTIANKTIRDTLNKTLDESATNLGIKDSLQKQFALYHAMENIAPKAAEEANTPLLRTFAKVGKVLGVKNRLVQAVATAAGIGGLGAAATFAPAVALGGGAGFLIYKAGQLVMSPEVRESLGRLLQRTGHLLNPQDVKVLDDALHSYPVAETDVPVSERKALPAPSYIEGQPYKGGESGVVSKQQSEAFASDRAAVSAQNDRDLFNFSLEKDTQAANDLKNLIVKNEKYSDLQRLVRRFTSKQTWLKFANTNPMLLAKVSRITNGMDAGKFWDRVILKK